MRLPEMDVWKLHMHFSLCLYNWIVRLSKLGGRIKLKERGLKIGPFHPPTPQEPHRVYPSIPANQRRPIKVLSLFDGIATGEWLFYAFTMALALCVLLPNNNQGEVMGLNPHCASNGIVMQGPAVGLCVYCLRQETSFPSDMVVSLLLPRSNGFFSCFLCFSVFLLSFSIK